jgi:hypothetical protein
MKKIILLSFIFLLLPLTTDARSGCCSHHDGVCGCGCCDGTSLSATCAPYYPECNSKPVVSPVVTTPPPTVKTPVVPEPQPEPVVENLPVQAVEGETVLEPQAESIVETPSVDKPDAVQPVVQFQQPTPLSVDKNKTDNNWGWYLAILLSGSLGYFVGKRKK